jgi:hypothetical protein
VQVEKLGLDRVPSLASPPPKNSGHPYNSVASEGVAHGFPLRANQAVPDDLWVQVWTSDSSPDYIGLEMLLSATRTASTDCDRVKASGQL